MVIDSTDAFSDFILDISGPFGRIMKAGLDFGNKSDLKAKLNKDFSACCTKLENLSGFEGNFDKQRANSLVSNCFKYSGHLPMEKAIGTYIYDVEEGFCKEKIGYTEIESYYKKAVELIFENLPEQFQISVSLIYGPLIELLNSIEPLNKLLLNLRELNYQGPKSVHFPNAVKPDTEVVGREEDLKEARNRLDTSKLLVVEGMGGIGKTTFALKLAQQWPVGTAHFIEFSNSFTETFSSFKNGYFIDGIDKDKTADEATFSEILATLNTIPENELLIIDNVKSSNDGSLDWKVVQRNLKCHVIITTREEKIISGDSSLHLNELSLESCITLFKNTYEQEITEEEYETVKDIVKRALNHTLVVKLLAGAAKASDDIDSLDDLQQLMIQNGNFSLPLNDAYSVGEGEKVEIFTKHMDALFDISEINNIDKTLLNYLSVLDMSSVKTSDLKEWCVLENSNQLNSLVRKGWLDKSSKIYSMHDAIHETLHRNLKPTYSDIEELYTRLNSVDITNANFSSLKPQAKALLSRFYETRDFAYSLYDYADKRNNIVEALDIYSLICEKAEKVLDEKSPQLAASYNNMGILLQAMGKLDEAYEYYKLALAIREEVLDEKSPDLAISYNNMGSLLRDMGKLDEAYGYYKLALAIREEVLDEKSPSLATSYNNMGTLLQGMGKLNEAYEYYKLALAIREEVLDEKSPQLATSYNNMGLLLKAMGRLDEAYDYYKLALAIREEVLDEKSPDLATSYNNMGGLLYAMGRLDEAYDYRKKALTIEEEVLYKKSPQLAASYNNMGLLLKAMGKLNEAYEYYEKALAIGEEVLDEKSPLLASCYGNMAGLLMEMNKTEEAFEYLLKWDAITGELDNLFKRSND